MSTPREPLPMPSEQLREAEQLGYVEQGQLEANRDSAVAPEGVAEIDIATGQTLREEHVSEPPPRSRPADAEEQQ